MFFLTARPLAILAVFICGLTMIVATATTALAQVQSTSAETILINAQDLIPRAAVFISPASQTLLEGSTFDVSIYLDTKQSSVNTLDIKLKFSSDKLAIVSPSVGKSLIQLWLQPPVYSNMNGTARLSGVIPNGIVTQSGLITTITFRALASGEAKVIISPDSTILANDGLGTQMRAELGRAAYIVTPKPPEGVVIFSPTHPFQSKWYNNNNPVLQWQKDFGVTEFSYVIDDQPFTAPGNLSNATGTSAAYQNLGDGLWYFHVKTKKLSAWSTPSHFLVRVDTQPPAGFTPIADIISGSTQNKILVSFFTTDALSGIDHYEVAVIDKQISGIASPVFAQTESPYQLSVPGPGSYQVIVRAFDRAGNVRDVSLAVTVSIPFIEFLKKNDLTVITGLLLFVLFLFMLHYFFGHKLLRKVHRAIVAVEHAGELEKLKEAEEFVQKEKKLAAAKSEIAETPPVPPPLF